MKMDLYSYNVDPRIRKRTLGRPKNRWSDVFGKITGRQWTHEA
jgi:hypothetical protein